MVEIEVTMATAMIPVSAEALSDGRDATAAFRDWMAAKPEVRAARALAASEGRQRERNAAGPDRPLTLDGLLDKLGFSREYAEHLMQPYCYCGDSYDGWDYCQHARDLGITS